MHQLERQRTQAAFDLVERQVFFDEIGHAVSEVGFVALVRVGQQLPPLAHLDIRDDYEILNLI